MLPDLKEGKYHTFEVRHGSLTFMRSETYFRPSKYLSPLRSLRRSGAETIYATTMQTFILNMVNEY